MNFYVVSDFFLSPVSTTPVINLSPVSKTRGRITVYDLSPNNTDVKFMTGVNYTGHISLNTNIHELGETDSWKNQMPKTSRLCTFKTLQSFFFLSQVTNCFTIFSTTFNRLAAVVSKYLINYLDFCTLFVVGRRFRVTFWLLIRILEQNRVSYFLLTIYRLGISILDWKYAQA